MYIDIICIKVATHQTYTWSFRMMCSGVDLGIIVYEGRVSYLLTV